MVIETDATGYGGTAAQRRGALTSAGPRAAAARAVGDGQSREFGPGDGNHRAVEWAHRRTVQHWLQRFATGGAAALCDAPRSGRPVQADAAYLHALDAALATTPATLGLPYDVWTSARLSAYLADRTGVRIAPSWLRTLLKRRDYVHGRPKHTLTHLQDPVATVACAEQLAAVEKKGG